MRFIKRIVLWYRMWRNPYLKAIINFDPKYVDRGTWDNPLNWVEAESPCKDGILYKKKSFNGNVHVVEVQLPKEFLL